jgi:type II secretory pathway pseudopilin PulG
MAKKEVEVPNVFSGFEALSKLISPGTGGPVHASDPDSEIPYIDPEDLQKEEEVEEVVDEEEVVEEPEEVIEPKVKTTKKPVETVEEPEEVVDEPDDDDDELETEVTSFLKDRLSEELGWELDEDEKLGSLKDIVDYMKEVVAENSKPKYHSDTIAKLDDYVKNGGSVDKFFKEVYGGPSGIDYDNLDLSRESNQRLVIKELLKTKGYDDSKIEKAIDRYEKSETLAEESEDAVELLKDYKIKQEKKLLEEQEKISTASAKQQQMFYENVQKSVKSLENVRGIKISTKEKDELLDYIFKPASDGFTNYQKDYMSDIKNLIESAYFTKKGDSLIADAQKKGSSDAYKEFHQKIKANKGKRSKGVGTPESSSDFDFLGSISKNLLNKV